MKQGIAFAGGIGAADCIWVDPWLEKSLSSGGDANGAAVAIIRSFHFDRNLEEFFEKLDMCGGMARERKRAEGAPKLKSGVV